MPIYILIADYCSGHQTIVTELGELPRARPQGGVAARGQGTWGERRSRRHAGGAGQMIVSVFALVKRDELLW